jgi:hypothetical protein
MKSRLVIGRVDITSNDGRRRSTSKNVSISPVIRNYYANNLVQSEDVSEKSNLFIDGVGDVNVNDGNRRSPAYSTPDPTFINKSSMEGLILPFGIISGSSQLTASLDVRYIVSGTINIDTYLDNHIFIGSGSFGG